MVQYSAVKELLHEGIRKYLNRTLRTTWKIYTKVSSKRTGYPGSGLSFSSLGKEKGMLLGFKADGVIIGSRCLDKVIIAIYSKPLWKTENMQLCLIGVDKVGRMWV